jgi:hypothetical protein
MYRIREVNAQEEDVSEVLDDLHRLTFFGSAPLPDFDLGHWWLAFQGAEPVAFAGLVQSKFRVSLSCGSDQQALGPIVAAPLVAGCCLARPAERMAMHRF